MQLNVNNPVGQLPPPPSEDDKLEERVPHIQVSELFGPTYQGEGLDIGKPCFFIRLQHCPVKCPGCDTHYTWDGTETGEKKLFSEITDWAWKWVDDYPGSGIVLSGGEPLIHYRNGDFKSLLLFLKRTIRVKWISIETSGYVGKKFNEELLVEFLAHFDTITISPKITPCLHGIISDEDMLLTQPVLKRFFRISLSQCCYKFVVRDQADVEAVLRWDAIYRWRHEPHPIYLMPYGIHRDEVLKSCEFLLPICAKYGFAVSPRLHTILWDSRRGV